jgi:hypothetical protein
MDPAYFQKYIDKLPQGIIDEFKLRDLVNKKGTLLAKVTGGMYGHPLVVCVGATGAPGTLWFHITRDNLVCVRER